MKHFLRLSLLLVIMCQQLYGQSVDTLPPTVRIADTVKPPVKLVDTARPVSILVDSIRPAVLLPIETVRINRKWTYADVLANNPWFNFRGVPVLRITHERNVEGKERLFYLFAGLLIFFGIIKLSFGKYLNNLLSLVFRVSLKQKQIREQLIQSPLPSLLLNLFFVLVSGIYVVFLLQYNGLATNLSFWLLLLYATVGVGAMYLVKFVVLKFTGWVFNIREAADTYIFIVFIVNKLLGLFLLPVLILMAFAEASWWPVLVTISYVMVVGFFLYRYFASFAPVRREVKVSQFHFFLYLCAFEIAPLILIYKVLLRFL